MLILAWVCRLRAMPRSSTRAAPPAAASRARCVCSCVGDDHVYWQKSKITRPTTNSMLTFN